MRNMVLFISLSLFFVHIQNSINTGVSSFDLEKFVSLLTTEKTMVLLSLLSIFSVLYANRISKIFFALFSFFVIYNGFATFFTKLDKIILLMNGLYVVLAYFFYLFWHFELNESVYVPGFSTSMIGKKSLYNIQVELLAEFRDPMKGIMTNWDEVGCFIALDDEFDETIKKNVKIYISFAGKEFCQWGEIISGYGNGVGIKFFEGEDEHDLDLKWKDFFSIITDRGYDQYSEI
ncbi:MAG: hypothetical protein A2485_06010 [Bdellovibrionales bacterium RIFOXYC12_FULL_39_17]|nr:MAG: hypothetical protein A2485_06010 [Bdellovibrionales bacterium RIFOXYC12_FULL_39_17]